MKPIVLCLALCLATCQGAKDFATENVLGVSVNVNGTIVTVQHQRQQPIIFPTVQPQQK